jgi:DNA repair protein RadC
MRPSYPALVGDTPQVPVRWDPDKHRSRMRSRLLRFGWEALADDEILELVLFPTLGEKHTGPVVRALLDKFGGFVSVITAPVADLNNVDGLGETGTVSLKAVHAGALRLTQLEPSEKPLLARRHQLMRYLYAALAREPVEQFHVLYLDAHNRLLLHEPQTRDTINHAPVYPREVVKRALELNATGLILVHNHPSGDPTPSPTDIRMTREVKAAAELLSVEVQDHIIVGHGGWVSLRNDGLI